VWYLFGPWDTRFPFFALLLLFPCLLHAEAPLGPPWTLWHTGDSWLCKVTVYKTGDIAPGARDQTPVLKDENRTFRFVALNGMALIDKHKCLRAEYLPFTGPKGTEIRWWVFIEKNSGKVVRMTHRVGDKEQVIPLVPDTPLPAGPLPIGIPIVLPAPATHDGVQRLSPDVIQSTETAGDAKVVRIVQQWPGQQTLTFEATWSPPDAPWWRKYTARWNNEVLFTAELESAIRPKRANWPKVPDLRNDVMVRGDIFLQMRHPHLDEVLDEMWRVSNIPIFAEDDWAPPDLIIEDVNWNNIPLWQAMEELAKRPGISTTWKRDSRGYILAKRPDYSATMTIQETDPTPAPAPAPETNSDLWIWIAGGALVVLPLVGLAIYKLRRPRT